MVRTMKSSFPSFKEVILNSIDFNGITYRISLVNYIVKELVYLPTKEINKIINGVKWSQSNFENTIDYLRFLPKEYIPKFLMCTLIGTQDYHTFCKITQMFINGAITGKKEIISYTQNDKEYLNEIINSIVSSTIKASKTFYIEDTFGNSSYIAVNAKGKISGILNELDDCIINGEIYDNEFYVNINLSGRIIKCIGKKDDKGVAILNVVDNNHTVLKGNTIYIKEVNSPDIITSKFVKYYSEFTECLCGLIDYSDYNCMEEFKKRNKFLSKYYTK